MSCQNRIQENIPGLWRGVLPSQERSICQKTSGVARNHPMLGVLFYLAMLKVLPCCFHNYFWGSSMFTSDKPSSIVPVLPFTLHLHSFCSKQFLPRFPCHWVQDISTFYALGIVRWSVRSCLDCACLFVCFQEEKGRHSLRDLLAVLVVGKSQKITGLPCLGALWDGVFVHYIS